MIIHEALRAALEESFPEKQFFWGDEPATIEEVLDEQALLPILVRQARTTAAAASRTDFLAGFDCSENDDAALSRETSFPRHPPATGFAPMLLFLLDSVHLAAQLTPVSGHIDLQRIDPPVVPKPEDFLGRPYAGEQDAFFPTPE